MLSGRCHGAVQARLSVQSNPSGTLTVAATGARTNSNAFAHRGEGGFNIIP